MVTADYLNRASQLGSDAVEGESGAAILACLEEKDDWGSSLQNRLEGGSTQVAH